VCIWITDQKLRMQLFVAPKPSSHKTVILTFTAVRTSSLKLTHHTLWPTQQNNTTHNPTPTPTQYTIDRTMVVHVSNLCETKGTFVENFVMVDKLISKQLKFKLQTARINSTLLATLNFLIISRFLSDVSRHSEIHFTSSKVNAIEGQDTQILCLR